MVQGFTSGMPVQADMRGLVFNLAVASGDAATYKAVQRLYEEVNTPALSSLLLFVQTRTRRTARNSESSN